MLSSRSPLPPVHPSSRLLSLGSKHSTQSRHLEKSGPYKENQVIRNQENQVLIKIYGWHLVEKTVKVGRLSKKFKVKSLRVIRMNFPIVENLSGLQESILCVFLDYLEASNSILVKNPQSYADFIKFPTFPFILPRWANSWQDLFNYGT